MEFHERIQKIIDTYENGVKSRFAKKAGLNNQVYNLLRPSYKPGKIIYGRILSAYPDISAEWLTSDTGDMKADKVTQPKENETLQHSDLPDSLTSHQVLSYIQKYSGTDSLAKLSVKLNVKLSDLNRVFNGEKPMGRLATKIHKVFPELPVEWIRTGRNSFKSKSSPKKQEVKEAVKFQLQTREVKQETIEPQFQPPINISTPVKTMQSDDDKSYIQALELQIQSILKINEGILSDYQRLIKVNQHLNNAVIELTEKVISRHKQS